MPSKSRHGKGKRHQHSKKSGTLQRYSAIAPQPPVVTGTPTPATTLSTSPPAKAPAPPTNTGASIYPYVTAEIRRIGILTVIILVILIVLSRILS